ncbi:MULTISPECIES: sensor histidine kinase [unclassified Oceanispirochaeta]|uniref:sensor histidine kinase n=1 Tax=unclassified Oceanispirochaeta TaxID=2635722 RepID=UPI000E09866E|nr:MULTISPECIES: histidine kinase [unclassified Oceanispirochaeta]MBF9016401.1 histidine kinase [Oceanispirochaeta sp. M2]NPD72863.1 histidine kinase [Oceanispirochaeta sp. M1]RDG31441.1 HAMP domain-containing protein [Oceanispirochaeta sp. M1]
MKLIRKIVSTTMTSSIFFIFIFSITVVSTRIMLNLKDLSNQTIEVLSDWNALDRLTNDVLYYRLDSVSRLESIEANWIQATADLDESFGKLKNNKLLNLLSEDINNSLEESWYLWLFSQEKLIVGQQIFNDILHGDETNARIDEIDRTTFYEKLLFLKDTGGTYQEKQIYQSFFSHMYVLDVTSEDFTILLKDINKKIPDEIDSYIYYILITVVISLILVIIVSLLSAKRTIQPIVRLAGAVREMSDNDYPADMSITGNIVDEDDELSIINDGFNRMAVKIHALYDESLSREKEKRDAQFRALQYQINPHFLYNTLATLQMTAAVQGYKNMAENIQSLSRLLRNTISKSDHFITVSEELNIMNDYINIIQIRYKNRLIFKSSVNDRISEMFIPALILQPLLENAVLHGLSEKLNRESSDALLNIEGTISEDHLILTIFDNGKGISSDKIPTLLSKEINKNTENSVHIGLKNINDRIILLYGAGYGVNIESVQGEYTRVSLKLPLITEEENA